MPDLKDVHDQGAAPAHPSEVTLAAFLDGELPEEQATEVERHLEECRACRTLLAATVRVLAGDDESNGRARVPQPPETRHADVPQPMRAGTTPAPWRRTALAIAAAIAVILLVRPDAGPPSGGDTIRSAAPAAPGEGLAVLAVHAPAYGDSVRAGGLTFTWGASVAERYRLVVTNEEGTPVWSIDTGDTTAVLPDSVALRPGALYFWHADAVSSGVAATTRLQRFTVLP